MQDLYHRQNDILSPKQTNILHAPPKASLYPSHIQGQGRVGSQESQNDQNSLLLFLIGPNSP